MSHVPHGSGLVSTLSLMRGKWSIWKACDTDSDGVDDSLDPDDDNDGIPDEEDPDDDNDGIPDLGM